MASILRVASAVALVLLPHVQASSSSSSAASQDVNISINTTDVCGQDEYYDSCWYPVSCKTCLSRAGCAVDVSTGNCVSSSSISEIATTSGSNAQYFLSGDVKYCSAIDQACISCRTLESPDVCVSSSGDCVCVFHCELLSAQPSNCKPGPADASSGSLIACAAVLFPLLTYLVFKGNPCSAGCSLRRLLQRRRRDKNRRSLPGALKLDAWRTQFTERNEPVDEQSADLELRSCFVPMASTRSHQRQPRGEGSAETGAPVHVEDGDVASAVAETDLAFSPSAGGRRNEEQSMQLV